MTGAPLRSCSAGGGHHLGHTSPSFGGKYRCPLHQWSLMHGFDPRPQGQGGTDSTVKFIDGSTLYGVLHDNRYEVEWCVIARDGDVLTLRRLGFPDSEPVTTTVGQVYPADPGAVYRHAGKCGRAPATAAVGR